MIPGEAFDTTLAAAQAGAEWALAAVYRANNPRILRYLRAKEPGEAEDLASDTWIDVARNLASFSGDEDAFRGWVFTIARRRLADHRRRTRRRRADPTSDEASESLSVPSAEADAMNGRLGDEAAQRIVASLPPDQAEVVLLRVVADLSVERVAEIIGRRPGTVRVLQHRALRRLARETGGDL